MNAPFNANANAVAGPSRLPRKSARPFVSSDNRPTEADGVFRVVLITSGSVASIRAPDIAAALSQSGDIAVQVVSTKSSTHFCNQTNVDEAVKRSFSFNGTDQIPKDFGVRVWTDEDEWSDWKKVGEPILHIELRRWADLVVVAPCSANTLAKIAGGLCDNLATSLLRALSPETPVILCPAMNTHMYQHKFTAKHLRIVQEELEYLILGPQGGGKLACGDEGPGKMTDWREIVYTIENFAAMHKSKVAQQKAEKDLTLNNRQNHSLSTNGPHSEYTPPSEQSIDPCPFGRSPTPPTPNRSQPDLPTIDSINISSAEAKPSDGKSGSCTPSDNKYRTMDARTASLEHWKSMQNETFWKSKWWAGM
ncbi:uncharacterized protein L201_004224 [Kwoniella dendrophila CBS 6074]|uniref:Flavoprotein domain-containing protein n=1 Tax=Kwoniella dendrophila CBS 6074 TaxID=1295534 RepID=A0AAX4JWU6_9TREE